MSRHLPTSLLFASIMMAAARSRAAPSSLSIVPRPLSIEVLKGSFALTPATRVLCGACGAGDGSPAPRLVAEDLARRLRAGTGYPIEAECAEFAPETAGHIGRARAPARGGITLLLTSAGEELGPEGYTLDVRREGVTIVARSPAGLLYGAGSFLQLLPPDLFREAPPAGMASSTFARPPTARSAWKAPCVRIVDRPRFAWRGMHLDVSRHFFPKESIKRYIDILAMHRMNRFHWHLTDDQGWRIEIRRYPRLTEVGAWRADRESDHWLSREPLREGEAPTYGGFYTQDDVKEIVRYARDRNITVVPEIEMPAHAMAALAAYPEYSCRGEPIPVPPGSVWPDTHIFCAGSDATFEFLENVLSEVVDLFPSPFIHIGGDEADKKEWRSCPKCQARIRENGLKDEDELQSWFVGRIGGYLASRGRRLIGWDEILEGGLPPGASVMSWRGMDGGTAAAKQGHDVVMTPGTHCYFDHYQGNPDYEPPAIGGLTPLSKVYAFEPLPEGLTDEESRHILGAQGNVWTEYIEREDKIEYMVLPRMAALSEVLWSPEGSRDWNDFARRLQIEMRRYEALGYTWARSAWLVNMTTTKDPARRRGAVVLGTEMPGQEIRYTLDGTAPTPSSRRYTKPLPLERSMTVRAAAFRGGRAVAADTRQEFLLHKGAFRKVSVAHPFEKYTGGGEFALTDTIRGSRRYDDGRWQGFQQVDLDAVIDLGKVVPLARATASFLQDIGVWIWFPSEVTFELSIDGRAFQSAGTVENGLSPRSREPSIQQFALDLHGSRARFVRVRAKNVGLCPDWHPGAGEKAWLFADEIVLE